MKRILAIAILALSLPACTAVSAQWNKLTPAQKAQFNDAIELAAASRGVPVGTSSQVLTTVEGKATVPTQP